MFDFLSKKFSSVLNWMTGKHKLSEKNIDDALSQVREALLQADVPLDVVSDFLSQLSSEVVGQKVHEKLNPGNHFIKIVNEKLTSFLAGGTDTYTPKTGLSFQYPSVVMVMGLQGSGKTTSIAKLAHMVNKTNKKKNRRILCASVDFYRPAAVEQLEILSKKVGVDFYKSSSTNPLEATREILSHYKNNSYELCFLDTAGRLHIDRAMMEELQSISTIACPKYKLLVLDSMTGQESLNVAKEFDAAIGFDSAILTKMDSDTRGGAAFAFRYALKKPISLVGCGEKIDDIEPFIPERIASRILGMGDVLSLIEKANEKIDEKKQESMANRMMSGKLTLDDFAEQMKMMSKLGSMGKIMKYIPGFNSVSPEMLEQGELQMKQFKAILSSMTPKEKFFPQILNGSRKERIANGSGTKVQIINQLLQKFEETKQFAKMFKKMGKFPRFK